MKNSSHSTESEFPISSQVVFEGRLIQLRLDEVEYEGHARRFEVVTHGAAAVIIARPDLEHLVLVEQWRHAAGRRLWEVPAGLVDNGESDEHGALRELREETGYRAGRIRKLFSAYTAPGFCTELLHFYLAEELTAGEREPDEGEESMIVRTFHHLELQEMIENGEILDMKTLLAISWAREQAHPSA